jgi:hypothetical protein
MGTSQKKKMERLAIRFRRSETMLWARVAMAIHRRASILKNQSNGQY